MTVVDAEHLELIVCGVRVAVTTTSAILSSVVFVSAEIDSEIKTKKIKLKKETFIE